MHRSRRVLPDEREDLERLAQYIIRNPFAVEKMQVSAPNQANPDGSIIYRSGLNPKIQRNFEVFSPCDFIAAITQHIPDKSFQLVRYYGWYSNKSRGMRKKAAAEAAGESPAAEGASPGRSSQSWAILIKRVYEVDPLSCQECGSQMRVVAFIEPPQRDVIEEILRGHQSGAMVGGLWRSSKARAPPTGSQRDGLASAKDPNSATDEMTFVDMDTFEANF